MKHFGDITKLNGADLPVVDCITGGSPCQDLSVAGKRAGLDGERSGLFMEQIRIIKEMRENDRRNGRTDEFIRPRYMVWENVPGAFSSNQGEDFRIVLEETAKVADSNAVIPRLAEGQRWATAGAVMGDRWSIAWRVHDAQFWGVPQRRRRIALVADFGGQSAPEILFERKGVSGDSEPRESQREGTSQNAERSAGKAMSYCLQGNGIDRSDTAGCNGKGWKKDQSYTLNTIDRHGVCFVKTARSHSSDEAPTFEQKDTSPTLNAFDRGGQRENTICVCFQNTGKGWWNQGEIGQTVRTPCGGDSIKANLVGCFKGGNGSKSHGIGFEEQKSPTLSSAESGTNRAPVLCFTTEATPKTDEKGCAFSVRSRYYKDAQSIVENISTVRRLTPLECERFQGYPDGWTDIGEYTDTKGKSRKTSDSARYKALGNSIALPFWDWLLGRISEQYDRPATLGSLFDGIGGFPLCWETHNGKGTALWASEIEEFPIAVTKRHFPDEDVYMEVRK